MTDSTATHNPTTVTNIGVVMFTVADQDAAIAFYTDKLGLRAPRGRALRRERREPLGRGRPSRVDGPLALNPPMGGQPAVAASASRRPTSSASTDV
jgi:catechol 2,3-dioxygenase-like lactoylglutathione lyase family enzyme